MVSALTYPILVVDDHPAIRMAVCQLLRDEGFDVVAQAEEGGEALRLLEDLQPCTVILDIGMGEVDGLTVINHILERKWAVKIIVLTGQEALHIASRCMSIGVHGFVSKRSELRELVTAVRAVQANYRYFPSHVSFAQPDFGNLNEQKLLESLSSRELRVLQQLTQGLSNKEIADLMVLSQKTVSTYKARLFHKLNVETLVDLFILAKRNKLI